MRTLKFLNSTRQYWDDVNEFAQMNRDYFNAFHLLIKPDPKLQLMEGSEITIDRTLGNALPNYKRFGERLKENVSFDYRAFLPKLPKEVADVSSIPPEEYIELMRAPSFLLSPLFLSRWIGSKKQVCEINAIENVPLVDPIQQNFLRNLPSENCIVCINKPIFAGMRMYSEAFKNDNSAYSNMFVQKVGDLIKVFLIPHDVEQFPLGKPVRDRLNRFNMLMKEKPLNLGKIDTVHKALFHDTKEWATRVYNFVYLRINILTGKVCVPHEERLEWQEVDLLESMRMLSGLSTEQLLERMKADWDISCILYMLNGLGKILATYSPAQISEININNSSSLLEMNTGATNTQSKPISVKNLEWFDVRPSNITHIEISSAVLKEYIKKEGSAKKPHPRNPVYRHLPSGQYVFVSASGVHQDIDQKIIDQINDNFKAQNPHPAPTAPKSKK